MEIYELHVLCRERLYKRYYVGPVGLESAREDFARFKENEFAKFVDLYECDINSGGIITTGHNLEHFERS